MATAPMSAPTISVTMVIRDVERFLGEAIESILRQSLRDFEFIILDFGSSDQSAAIASSWAEKDDRVRFDSIEPCTLPEARNAAISRARGRYVAVMDADDIAAPTRLQEEFEFLEKSPGVGVVGSATEWIDQAGRALRIDYFPTEDAAIRLALLNRCPFCQPSTMIRKEALDWAGGYRTAFLQAEDYDLWTRIAERYQCANLRKTLLKYRIHSSQISAKRQQQQALCVLAAQQSALARSKGAADPMEGVREIGPKLLGALGVSEKTQEKVVAMHCRQWVRHMYLAREYPMALQAAGEILDTYRGRIEEWQIADLYLQISAIAWKQMRFAKSIESFVRALTTRPAIIGRPFRNLASRLGMRRQIDAERMA